MLTEKIACNTKGQRAAPHTAYFLLEEELMVRWRDVPPPPIGVWGTIRGSTIGLGEI